MKYFNGKKKRNKLINELKNKPAIIFKQADKCY